jgi:hypothetical protein
MIQLDWELGDKPAFINEVAVRPVLRRIARDR